MKKTISVSGLWAGLGAALIAFSPSVLGGVTDLADFPMAVSNEVTPNVLVIYDNSQSMDAFMNGKLVSGNNPLTRGNIGRQVMRNAITNYRNRFRWGLMSFRLGGELRLFNTYAYYFGSDQGMVFTDDCVNGISTSNGNRRCVANLQPFPGGRFLTYDRSGDDADILDVLYSPGGYANLWMRSSGTGTCFFGFEAHNAVNSWNESDFSYGIGRICFTPTDAGYLVVNPPYTRQYYVPRGLGYYAPITGAGEVLEPVMPDGAVHFNNLMSKLAAETINPSTSELKNAAVFTPLKGSLVSAKSYFSGNSSPIIASCQKNFVMLVTDGLPTGTSTGELYSEAARTNVYDAAKGTWSFGAAAQDAINAAAALRATSKGTATYDIPTYVLALGDTVSNAGAMAVMDAIAAAGNTTSAKLATDEATFVSAVEAVSQDILSKSGAAAAVTVANPNVVVGGLNASYNSTYNSGTWTGDVNAYPIDATSGTVDLSKPMWTPSPQARLDARTPEDRFIVSYSGASGIQFQPSTANTATKLTPAQQALFNSSASPPGPADSAAVIAYLRGDRSREGASYRSRSHLLGDIVNAEPVLVQPPMRHYADDCYSAAIAGLCGQSYVDEKASRPNVLFQAANDGMVHAFDVRTGAELWAYIPKLIWPGLGNLTKKAGFTHKYLVDATPVAGDVDFGNVSGGNGSNRVPNWRTILVGGLGAGGRGYYALDVTNPVATSEADAASKVLWEFPDNSTQSEADNIGYSFGRPLIVKTETEGWVVVIPSGYNNVSGNGRGYLFVLNARTGALIKKISTGVGTASNPSGLAKISAYVENGDIDNTVTAVYGGDLLGNVWRFNLSGNKNSWNAVKLATLVDGGSSGLPQPVTSEPEIATITVEGVDYRYVYVGTGSYLGDSDVPTTQVQTMYGLIDDLSASPLIFPLRSQLQQQTLSTAGSGTRNVTNNAITVSGASGKKGWYVDLSLSAGERVVSDPQLALGALNFTTIIPSSGVCVPGGSSWFYSLNYKTGGLVANSTVAHSGSFLGDALASRPTLIKLPTGAVKGVIRMSDTTTIVKDIPVPLSVTAGRRVSWREVMTN
ncbi:type IV pilus assembly protein PilY1 [Noviherbaspirillum humi]|uniref:Type IV pilus assembly protein PilY1 n=1 Tax=Noviherbaspirillum humi TaxID=1688639 RepID=A0A239KN08_9BURK|nr:PilC/PilY family type IV pilus protein [Noviherbaspirillum humi]SNT19551.1 type IV pilus assembly protein PilY1 [Noviherbaspirillum humi]